MTLLEVIKKALENSEALAAQSDYPIVLNPDDVLPTMKPKVEDTDPLSLVNPIVGWKISKLDSKVINLNKDFHSKLMKKLKNPKSFSKDDFIGILNSFLETLRERTGISIGLDSSDNGPTWILIEILGFLMGKDVASLVLEACVVLEVWELVETLILNALVKHSAYSNLIPKLVEKRCSNLICLCIKHAPDLGPSELLCILRYFLRPPKDAYESMLNVRKEWENQALIAIDKASDKNIKGKKSRLARDAAILLMIAHDGFSNHELCLHYLLASQNLDEVILSSALGKLNDKEMVFFIRYLDKWLKKYERFPQVGPCPKASTMLGLKACDWVPKLEDVVRCFGILLDENFSSLVLNQKFHEELRSMEELVSSLALDARLCSSVANIAEKLRIEVKGE